MFVSPTLILLYTEKVLTGKRLQVRRQRKHSHVKGNSMESKTKWHMEPSKQVAAKHRNSTASDRNVE